MPRFSELHQLERGHHLGGRPGARRGRAGRLDADRRPGATGYLDTDYAAKGRFGIEALEEYDIVCVHVEAPDEASHEGRHDAKVEALERIDSDIVGPIREALESYDQWRILISPDHSTLLRTRAHDRAPVAWAMAGTGLPASGRIYDELAAKDARGPYFDQGYRLMERFLDLSWDGRGSNVRRIGEAMAWNGEVRPSRLAATFRSGGMARTIAEH